MRLKRFTEKVHQSAMCRTDKHSHKKGKTIKLHRGLTYNSSEHVAAEVAKLGVVLIMRLETCRRPAFIFGPRKLHMLTLRVHDANS